MKIMDGEKCIGVDRLGVDFRYIKIVGQRHEPMINLTATDDVDPLHIRARRQSSFGRGIYFDTLGPVVGIA